jgi:hypothetical protein
VGLVAKVSRAASESRCNHDRNSAPDSCAARWPVQTRPYSVLDLDPTVRCVWITLTKLGSTLWEAVEPLGSWARAHVSEILTSREQFDAKDAG